MVFEWDLAKAVANVAKHGVTFEEAATVFRDTLSATIYDPLHSSEEDRFVTLGLSSRNRLIVAAHCDRKQKVRIISARRATRRERLDYENAKEK